VSSAGVQARPSRALAVILAILGILAIILGVLFFAGALNSVHFLVGSMHTGHHVVRGWRSAGSPDALARSARQKG